MSHLLEGADSPNLCVAAVGLSSMPKIYSKAGDIAETRRTAIGGAKLMLIYPMMKRVGLIDQSTEGPVDIEPRDRRKDGDPPRKPVWTARRLP